MRPERVIARATLIASIGLFFVHHSGCGGDENPPGNTGPGNGPGPTTGPGGGDGGDGGAVNAGGGPEGGGVPAVEDCYDGFDTDNNGEIDCVDPDAACSALCSDPCLAPRVLADPGDFNGNNTGFANMDASCTAPVGGGPTTVYQVTAANTGFLEVDVDAEVPTDDFTVSIRTTCGDADSELICAENVHGDVPPGYERATIPVTAGQTLYILVQGYASINGGPYNINVESYVPMCGDGKITGTETCDDGMMTPVSGDGCSDACQFEPSETAANDTLPGDAFVDPYFAEINPHNDVDVVNVMIPGPNYSMLAQTFDVGNGACSAAELDSAITIADAGLNQLASDDDSGEVYCAKAQAKGLTTGLHYVRVTASPKSAPTHTFIYQLFIDIDLCGNNTIGGAEQCDDGNLNNGDGCSSQCVVE
jgi:cysteine-rich repeat protein